MLSHTLRAVRALRYNCTAIFTLLGNDREVCVKQESILFLPLNYQQGAPPQGTFFSTFISYYLSSPFSHLELTKSTRGAGNTGLTRPSLISCVSSSDPYAAVSPKENSCEAGASENISHRILELWMIFGRIGDGPRWVTLPPLASHRVSLYQPRPATRRHP